MNKIRTILPLAVNSFYPLLAFGLLHYAGTRAVAWLLLALGIMRLPFVHKSKMNALMALLPLGMAGALWIVDSMLVARLYPVVMNMLMLSIFAASLLNPPSVIERFARLREPDLSERGVRYTTRVTIVWCGFFVVNGAIALWTALKASLATWAIYNGMISYLLIGMLFLLEWGYRWRYVRSV